MGALYRPDNGKKIETFDDLRKWKTASVQGSANASYHTHCQADEFEFDPQPGK